ncbi:MAG: hypothetical protein HZC17_06220 [Candidatus Omnitrophica bacterium]|nr:hypothetical protein [Candidatus Omnitrophota bacterium]
MITINLLPTEFRRKIEQPHVISLRFGMIVACLIVFVLWISLAFMVGTAKREMDNMSGDWKRLETGSKEADKIMLDINQNFLERKKTCDLISISDMSWAYVLNQISDLIPDSAWLRKIKLSSSGMDEWEFWMKGIEKAPEDEPAIKSIGHYISAIKPTLEQDEKQKTKTAVPGAGSRELNVQTSTAQETINNNVLTSFEATFTMKGKQDESVRDKHKSS